ncbi:MAG: response regulator [Verrucomicrobia bacterium]|nr:response regulator [Verrucomicrobiota bacterium]
MNQNEDNSPSNTKEVIPFTQGGTEKSTAKCAEHLPDQTSSEPKTFRILVAEDNLVNQRVAQRQLQQLGCVADVVTNGLAAVEALTKIPYDLVLMDCEMPVMDGFKTAAEIRRREGNLKHTPIIALTAHVLESEHEKCLAAGMDDCLSKPVKPAELKRVLDGWLLEGGRRREKGERDVGEARMPTKGSHAESPPVDMETLRGVTDGTEDGVRELVDLYLRQTRELLEQLDAALRNGDASETRRTAHKCAGSSAICGATNIVPPLRELERMGNEGCLDGAPAIALKINREFERLEAFLQSHIQRTPHAGGS